MQIWLRVVLVLLALCGFIAVWILAQVVIWTGGVMYEAQSWVKVGLWASLLFAVAAALAFLFLGRLWRIIFMALSILLFGGVMVFLEIQPGLEQAKRDKSLEYAWPRLREEAEAVFDCPGGTMIRAVKAEVNYRDNPAMAKRYQNKLVILYTPPGNNRPANILGYYPDEFDPEKTWPQEQEHIHQCRNEQGLTIVEYFKY